MIIRWDAHIGLLYWDGRIYAQCGLRWTTWTIYAPCANRPVQIGGHHGGVMYPPQKTCCPPVIIMLSRKDEGAGTGQIHHNFALPDRHCLSCEHLCEECAIGITTMPYGDMMHIDRALGAIADDQQALVG